MSAPIKEITLTPDIYERFAAYVKKELAWGVFHVSLDDGNYWSDVQLDWLDDEDKTPETLALINIHNRLTPSQRKKLASKAEEINSRSTESTEAERS
jgi:hypothetical protein